MISLEVMPREKITYMEAKKHYQEHCQKNRKCIHCNMQFNSNEEFKNHLRYTCEDVEIECHECGVKLPRRELRNHDCYLKAQEDLDIEKQVSERSETKTLRQENHQLLDKL